MRSAVRLLVVAGAVFACTNTADLGHFNSANIAVTDNQFGPALDSVSVSQNISWSFPSTNQNSHSINWTSGPSLPPNSGDRMPGAATYVQFFGQTGTYTYYCRFHGAPDGSGMAGTLVVK